MKFIFKWLLRLFILAVVLIVIALLSYNSILRLIIERNIRAQTGMDAEIGRFHLALTEPTIEIQNLKIYNSKDFGGTLFLDIPEIHVEYDRDALAHREIHLTLLRFNLGELNIVKNELGRTNILSLGGSTGKKSNNNPPMNFKKQTGYDFKGIDVLNVSVGTMKFIDLRDQRNDRTAKVGIQDWPLRDVKSENDLMSLAVFVELRSNYFFSSVFGNNPKAKNVNAMEAIFRLFDLTF
ncbi:MAG TPA: hypothetical protein VHG89_00885 [Verrucomicrobiae bacterium]|nr:hypothetical protein [Verrucomicrobiae bacterium]